MADSLLRAITTFVDRRTAPAWVMACRYRLEYLAMRLFALSISAFPIELNLQTARVLGRLWHRVMRRHRNRAMEHLRMALGDTYSERQLETIARKSFEHFAQLYLIELVQTPRLLSQWSWSRHIELGEIGPALRELLADRGAIMLTAHFGNFELLGYAIAKLGLPLVAVMRPLDNPLLNDFLMSSREASGLRLLYKKGATESAQEALENKETLCYIADQNAGRKGLFVDFFGKKASTYKSIGLLAASHDVPVIVGYAARIGRGFRYRIEVERIIRPEEWRNREDPVFWITQEYSWALESAIRKHPEQYLWMHRRWKSRPRDEE